MMDSLITDLQDLFSGRRAAHLGAQSYADSGAACWQELSEDTPAYYLSRDEVYLTKAVQEPLRQFVRDLDRPVTLLDFGPGTSWAVREKALALVRACAPVSYEAYDVNQDFAREAAAFVGTVTGIPSMGQAINYFAKPLRQIDDAIIYFGGGSIGNLDEAETLSSALTKIAAHISSGLVLASFDSNRDWSTLNPAYNNNANQGLSAAPHRTGHQGRAATRRKPG